MIPRQLYMRNFMCYVEQSLDLRGVHLACLSGDNGHGKSAILDAMTWALWGYSRVGARRDDELIHLGQTEMEVEFEFQLGKLIYRVIRKRDSRKRGSSSLELQGWDQQSERFRPLTEPTITRTQQAIIDLLRMDYNTFINSAFLLQGRADEFTIKPAGERKRVLGNILGLDIYTRYEQAARQAARDNKERADQLVAAIEQIDRELTRESEYAAAVCAAETGLAQRQQERAAAEHAHEQARARLREAELAQQQLTGLQTRIAQLETEHQRASDELDAHQARLSALQDALAHAGEIEQGLADYEQAVAQNESLNAKLGAMVALHDRRRALEQTISDARHELEKRQVIAADRARQLEQSVAALEREPEWDALRVQLSHLNELESERNDTQQNIQNMAAHVAALQAENKQATQDAEQIKEKIALLQAGDRADGAVCPLCAQPLEADGCARLLAGLETELEQKREDYQGRNIEIKLARQQIKKARAAIRKIDRALSARSALQRQEAALAHIIDQAKKARAQLAEAQSDIERLETQLRNQDFGQTAHAELRQVEAELGKLGYDAEAHQQVKNAIESLRAYRSQIQTLREARASTETVQLAIAQLESQRAEIAQQLSANQALAGELGPTVAQLPTLDQRARRAQQALEAAHDQEQQANLRLGAARSKVEYCADLRKQRVKRRAKEKQLRQDQAIYQELQEAFGKNGVQAMLIETAIPEIEDEANRLLARMSGGRMQVRFETQRQTKKGSAAETLDIHISDELGARSYETYSGGERYRINFGIRIALSRLLARRAGARLELLVIDEGFGTQDAEGRDGVLDAIQAVSDDFGCILVITHIDELKNAFNTRIEVEKTQHGSEITIT